MSGLRRAVQRGLLSLVMILLAGTVHAAPDPVLVLGRISDDPKAHYEQLQPLLDYLWMKMMQKMKKMMNHLKELMMHEIYCYYNVDVDDCDDEDN